MVKSGCSDLRICGCGNG